MWATLPPLLPMDSPRALHIGATARAETWKAHNDAFVRDGGCGRVVLDLAVWFGLHVFLFPNGKSLDRFALLLSTVALIGMLNGNGTLFP